MWGKTYILDLNVYLKEINFYRVVGWVIGESKNKAGSFLLKWRKAELGKIAHICMFNIVKHCFKSYQIGSTVVGTDKRKYHTKKLS